MDSLNGTIFDYSDELIYFDSHVDPGIYTVAFVLCLCLTFISFGTLGCSIYSPDIDHENEFFGSEEGPAWNNFSENLKRKKRKRLFIHIVWGFICAYLMWMTYATHMYSLTREVLTDIQESIYQSSTSCSENPDVTCCSYYDQCIEGDSGSQGSMDATSFMIGAYKEGGNAECPHIWDIIGKRDKLLNLQWSVPCEHTEHGCCMVDTMCDSYIRNENSYHLFENGITNRQSFARRGKIITAMAKVNPEGTNCGDESIRSILQSYAWSLLQRLPRDEGGRFPMNSYGYLPRYMQYATIGIIILTCILCIIGYFSFKEQSHNIIDSEDDEDEDDEELALSSEP